MNHHSFRELVKNMPAKDIKQNNMNPAHFKAVCFVLSMYGDYETGTNIRPSWLTVSREAGVNRKTAMKVRDWLLDQGIIIRTRVNEANISVYKFGQVSILEEQLSVSLDQLPSIVGHNTTYNTIEDITVNKKNQEEIDSFLKEVFS